MAYAWEYHRDMASNSPQATERQPEMNIIRKDVRDMTWQAIGTVAPSAEVEAGLKSCGLAIIGPLRYYDLDDPINDHWDLDESKQLIPCGDCGCLTTRVHDCVEPVTGPRRPENPYDWSEAR